MKEIIRKVRNDSLDSILLLAPAWSSRDWWSELKEIMVDVPLLLPRSADIFLKNGQKMGRPNWHVIVVRVSGNLKEPPSLWIQDTLDWIHRLRKDADLRDIVSIQDDLRDKRNQLIQEGIVLPVGRQ